MTWIAPPAPRESEPFTGDERAMLQGWLDWHRNTLLGICAGLTADQLRTAAVEPSPLTLLGLVRHMAYVERWWFRKNACGEELPELYVTEENPDGEFDVTHADAEADFATFADEVAKADAAVAGMPLEATFRARSGKRGEMSLRWVYLHMIEEYARHNGHADLIRERIDGATGL